MIVRARIVLPIHGPPIERGAVLLKGGRIRMVGPWSELRTLPGQSCLDLGERVLLPGLINAHCHLDYTNMAGLIRPPKHFTDWIQTLMALKATWCYSEFAQSWLDGAQMLLQTGTTTVVDIEAVPELPPEVWYATPLRVISVRELIQLRSRPQTTGMVERASREWAGLAGRNRWVGLSPHSPYATHAELLRQARASAQSKAWLLTTHVSESEEEFLMFTAGRGRLYDWLKEQRDMSDCGQGSPLQHLERCGYLGARLLAVHVNYLGPDDAGLLAQQNVSVAHCPRSHAYFGHQPFPYDTLSSGGVNLCLGTDSLATTKRTGRTKLELNLFAEMRTFAEHHPQVSPQTILEMVTSRAARALGRPTELGGLFTGARADLIALPYSGPLKDVFEAIVQFRGEVDGSMIDGRWVVELP